MVELNYVDTISDETVRKISKKPWQRKEWCIPPEANAEFVCKMEDILEVYKQPYNSKYPLICMDETSKVKKIREPLSAGKEVRYDNKYKRNGVSNLFI